MQYIRCGIRYFSRVELFCPYLLCCFEYDVVLMELKMSSVRDQNWMSHLNLILELLLD